MVYGIRLYYAFEYLSNFKYALSSFDITVYFYIFLFLIAQS